MELHRLILTKEFDLHTYSNAQVKSLSYLTSKGPLVEEVSCETLRSHPKYIDSDSDSIKWLFNLNSFEFIIITKNKIKLIKNGQVVVTEQCTRIISCACYEASLFILTEDNAIDVYNLFEMRSEQYNGARLGKVTTSYLPFRAIKMIAVPFYVDKVLFINKDGNLLMFDVYTEKIIDIYTDLDISGTNKISASPLLDVIMVEKDKSVLFYHLIGKKVANKISFDFENEKMIKLAIDIKSLNIFIITSINNLVIYNLTNQEVLQKLSLSKEKTVEEYCADDIIINIQNLNEKEIIIHNSKLNSITKLSFNTTKDFYETTKFIKGVSKNDSTSVVSFRHGSKFIFSENNKLFLTKLEEDTLRTEISFSELNKRLSLTGMFPCVRIPYFKNVVFSYSPGLKSRYCAVFDNSASFYIIDIHKKRAMPFLITISNSSNKIRTIRFTPDSTRVFVGTSRGTIEVYRVETGIREESKFDINNESPIVDIIFNTTTIDPTIITTSSIIKVQKTGFNYKVTLSQNIDGTEIQKCLFSRCRTIIGLVDKTRKNLKIIIDRNWENIRSYSFNSKIKEAWFVLQFFVLIATESDEIMLYDLLLKKNMMYFKFGSKIKSIELADGGRRLFCRFEMKPGVFCYKIKLENVLINNLSCDTPVLISEYGQSRSKQKVVENILVEDDCNNKCELEKKEADFASLLSNFNIKSDKAEFVEMDRDGMDNSDNTLLEKYQKKFFLFSFVKGKLNEKTFLDKYNTANLKRIETEFFYLWFTRISIESILTAVSKLFIKDKIDLTKMNVKMEVIIDTLKFFRKDILKDKKCIEVITEIFNRLEIPLENIRTNNLYISGNITTI